MLNGFGEATVIARLREELESEHAATVAGPRTEPGWMAV